MSGETEQAVSGWTVDTLKENIDGQLAGMDLRYQQRYDAQIKALDAALLAAEKAVQTALTAAEKAVTKAEVAAEKRFEAVNEFRQVLTDQTSTFLPRTEYITAHESLEKLVTTLTDRFNQAEGHGSGITAAWGYLAGAIGLAAAVVSIIIATR